MIQPTHTRLAAQDCPPGHYLSQEIRLHPNPRAFKYRYQIFSASCLWQGDAFFSRAPRLGIHAAQQEIARLLAAGQPCIVYNARFPRQRNPLPLDPRHPRWQGIVWACAYEDDPDPEWLGFR